MNDIFLAIQITKVNEIPFLNENFDELSPPKELTAYFRIIEGKNLLPMDSNGKNDAYCTVVNSKAPKQIKKTQILYESIDPKWNFFINIKIHDYFSDEIKISCYDYDLVGSNDLIGSTDFKVKNMGNGKIIDEWVPIFNNYKETGKLHIMYQICTLGWKPFSQVSIIPLKNIHIHVMDGYDIPNVDFLGKSDPYIRIKLNDQEFYEKTKVINNTLNPIWDQNFTLYSLCQNPSIQIELKDEATGKDPLIGTTTIKLDDIKEGETREITENLTPAKGMKKGGIVHLYIQINPEHPFFNVPFTKHLDTGIKIKKGYDELNKIEKVPTTKPLTLFVKVQDAFGLKALDSNGLSDPYCILQVNNQKKITSTIGECINPKWDEYFIFDLNSLYFDVLNIDCMDYDKLSKDDLIGNAKIEIKSLMIGRQNTLNISLYDKNKNFSGTLNLLVHVTRRGEIPFEEKIWNKQVLNIRIMEGNIKNNGYLYWTGKFDNEINNQFSSTQKKGNKWMEEFQMLYSYENTAILKLFEHKKKEIEIGEIKIPYNSLEFGKITDKFYDIGKNGLQ